MSSKLLTDGLTQMSNILFGSNSVVKLGQSSSQDWTEKTFPMNDFNGKLTKNATNQTIDWYNQDAQYSDELNAGVTLTYFFIYYTPSGESTRKVFSAPLNSTVVASAHDMIKIAQYNPSAPNNQRGIHITITFSSI